MTGSRPKQFLFSIVTVLLAASLTAPFPTPTLKLSLLGARIAGVPFGGLVLFTIPCTCNAPPTDQLVFVGPPKGGAFMKVATTRVYPKYIVAPGKYVLGLASPAPGICRVFIGLTCIPVGGSPKMIIVGTS